MLYSVKFNEKAENSFKQKLKAVTTCYVMAMQPWSFSISFAPVALGNVLSWREKAQFSFSTSVLSTIVVLCVHAASNAVYSNRDKLWRRYKKWPQDSPKAMVRIGVLFYIMACIAMLGVMCISPAKVEHLAMLFFGGLSASFLYTGGWSQKSRSALGDLLIIISFGPIAVLFSYVAQCGEFNLKPVLYAIPLALNAEAIFHSENVKDLEQDEGQGNVTTATILGHQVHMKSEETILEKAVKVLIYFVLSFT
ncbi:ubiA prenyltransferase domain-containing protein 1-like [Dendronephthya gigantea]|uniref:ubiA prenyltransferase domain-containing protein 1-like n=1 Tax=Dendronephthya gigantea TaxID=151771 RepID=UPI00106BA7C0|nr:ubiA prenyltransferase domain-containing protein 1-like [Dendronephthya gigantea]